MSKRKKRQQAEAKAAKATTHDGDVELGTWADRFPKIKTNDDDPFADHGSDSSSRPVIRQAAPPTPVEPPKRKVTESELMQEAFSAVGGSGDKFFGGSFAPDDVEVVTPKKQKAKIAVAVPKDVTQGDMTFFEAMAGVEAVAGDQDKYADLRAKQWAGARWRTQVELTKLTADELKEPTMTGMQRNMLRQSRKTGEMPVLMLRGSTRSEAEGELVAFVRGCCAKSIGFARVITGKGKQSVGEPVLKRLVIEWSEGQGRKHVRSWAPETDQTGQFGSVVLELKRPA